MLLMHFQKFRELILKLIKKPRDLLSQKEIPQPMVVMKKMVLVGIFLLLNSLQASGNTKIILLTSIDPKEGKTIFNSRNFNNNLKIEKEFKKSFNPSQFQVEVIHHAGLEDVWNALHDTSADAVFFLGHAGEETAIGSNGGMSAPSLIADENLYDLKNAFQSVHSHLKFLAVISCNAQKILNDFSKKGYYQNASQLKIKSYDKKISIYKGLREAIQEGLNVLSSREENDPTSIEDHIEKHKIVITRNNPATSPENLFPTLVILSGKVVGFFPKGKPGENQQIEIDLSHEDLNKKLILQNDSGTNSSRKKSNTILGELSINSDELQCIMTSERNSRGELLGISQNYYSLNCNY